VARVLAGMRVGGVCGGATSGPLAAAAAVPATPRRRLGGRAAARARGAEEDGGRRGDRGEAVIGGASMISRARYEHLRILTWSHAIVATAPLRQCTRAIFTRCLRRVSIFALGKFSGRHFGRRHYGNSENKTMSNGRCVAATMIDNRPPRRSRSR
jgi:hypothetical protein